MTKDRDFKRLIRARAAKTGEAYQAARRRLVADEQQQQRALRPEYERAVHDYFYEWARQLDQFQASGLRTPSLERSASAAGIRGGPLPALVGPGPHASWKAWEAALVVPVEAMQDAALFHANPRVRRECLSVLDHFASDASVDVFRRALRDPVPRVRLIALHGLSCEQCRVGQICVKDVVADLLPTVSEDPSAKVRHAAVMVLARFHDRDQRVRAALEAAAHQDADPLVRAVAIAATTGASRDIRSRKAMRRRLAKPRAISNA